MVNPGAFQGLRKEFLLSVKPLYADAVKDCCVQDTLAVIYRRYLKRFPMDLPHRTEPSQDHLDAVNDDSPDPEPTEPDRERLTDREYEAAMEGAKERKRMLEYRKAQIKHWLAYQYTKDNDVRAKENSSYNPYSVMARQLTGKTTAYPRMRTACNVWRKLYRETIETHLQGEIEVGWRLNKPIAKDQHAAIRDRIARELFSELPEEQRRHWRAQAKSEYNEAIDAFNREMTDQPSTEPADRQRAIQGLTQFMQPILDLICKATGWKATLIAGGPEPAHAGRLNVISVHSGVTSGDIKMTFGRSERHAYRNQIIPIFGNFLQKCYNIDGPQAPDECRARAIAKSLGFLPMSSLEAETNNFSVQAIGNTDEQANSTATAVPVPAQALSTTATSLSPAVTVSLPNSHTAPTPRSSEPAVLPSISSTGFMLSPSTTAPTLVGSQAVNTPPLEVSSTGAEGEVDITISNDENPRALLAVDATNPFPFDACTTPWASPRPSLPPSPAGSRESTPHPTASADNTTADMAAVLAEVINPAVATADRVGISTSGAPPSAPKAKGGRKQKAMEIEASSVAMEPRVLRSACSKEVLSSAAGKKGKKGKSVGRGKENVPPKQARKDATRRGGNPAPPARTKKARKV